MHVAQLTTGLCDKVLREVGQPEHQRRTWGYWHQGVFHKLYNAKNVILSPSPPHVTLYNTGWNPFPWNYITLSWPYPLISQRGGAVKMCEIWRCLKHHPSLSRPRLKTHRDPKSETEVQCCDDRLMCLSSLAKLGSRTPVCVVRRRFPSPLEVGSKEELCPFSGKMIFTANGMFCVQFYEICYKL